MQNSDDEAAAIVAFVAGLENKNKLTDAEVEGGVEAGEIHGCVDREPRRKTGRKRSPRNWQLHPKVMPEIGEEISEEGALLDIGQGRLIEMMWAAYKHVGREEARRLAFIASQNE